MIVPEKLDDYWQSCPPFGTLDKTLEDYLELVRSGQAASPVDRPVMSPDTSNAIENADKLVKLARRQLAEISDELLNSRDSKNAEPNENLLRLRELARSKFEEVLQPQRRLSAERMIAKKIKPQANRVRKQSVKRIAARVLLTDRGVQVDSSEAPKPETQSQKYPTLRVQKAQLVEISRCLSLQTIKAIHISPDASLAQTTENVGTFEYRYTQSSKARETLVGETRNFPEVEVKSSALLSKDAGIQTEEKFASPRKAEENSGNVEKLNDAEETLSLEALSFTDLDKMLKANNEILDQVTNCTSKFCKVLYKHVVAKNREETSSNFKRDSRDASVISSVDLTRNDLSVESGVCGKRGNVEKQLAENNVDSSSDNKEDLALEGKSEASESEDRLFRGKVGSAESLEESENSGDSREKAASERSIVSNNSKDCNIYIYNTNRDSGEESKKCTQMKLDVAVDDRCGKTENSQEIIAEEKQDSVCEKGKVFAEMKERISRRINEEMQIVAERMEKSLKRNDDFPAIEETKIEFSSEPFSEGEIYAASLNSLSVGEIKCSLMKDFSRIPLKTSTSNEDNSTLDTSVSSNNLLFSSGEIYDKKIRSAVISTS